MFFKNDIRKMVAVVINTLLETFPEVYLFLSALVQAESRRFPVEFFPSNPQEIEVDV